jgi:hypothetical protein
MPVVSCPQIIRRRVLPNDQDPSSWRAGLDVTHGTADTWQAAQVIIARSHDTFDYRPASTHARQLARAGHGLRPTRYF